MTTKRNLFKLAEPTDEDSEVFFSVLKKIKDLLCHSLFFKINKPPVQISPPLE